MLHIRRSQLFTKTSKTAPADESAKNAQLLIRAGYVHKEMAGVYAFLPLGLHTLENIKQIIREEMDAIGGNELSMTTLQNKDLWEKTGRWDDKKVDNWFKTKLANGSETGLGITHEEPITNAMRSFVSSYKDLPAYPYQFQAKFRNELRAKSGLMRGREFLMKDLYSFSRTEEERAEFYEIVAIAYNKIFERLGIGDHTYRTFASGGIFSRFSEEFQTVSEVGEDTIYIHKQRKVAVNKEVYSDDVLEELGIAKEELEEVRAVEVGNIFQLGTQFSEPLELYFTDSDGLQKPVIMGSYGIGPSRLVGLLAEHFADEKGLVWPDTVAPAKVYLISIGQNDEVGRKCEELFEALQDSGVGVIYDDRDVRPGEKFADADLMGMPSRVVVSERGIADGTFEIKERKHDNVLHLSKSELLKKLTN